MKASEALQRARAQVREPYTAFEALCCSQRIEPARESEATGYWLLYWASFDEGLELDRSHRTVKGQRATYDIAISMALSDEAVGL